LYIGCKLYYLEDPDDGVRCEMIFIMRIPFYIYGGYRLYPASAGPDSPVEEVQMYHIVTIWYISVCFVEIIHIRIICHAITAWIVKNRTFLLQKLHFIALKFGYLNIYLYLCTQEKVFFMSQYQRNIKSFQHQRKSHCHLTRLFLCP
jgi:hypothetical protein